MEPGQARRLQAAALGRLRRSFTAERQRQDPQTHVARTVLGELRATGELGLNPVGILTIFCWSERRDLNSGPPVPQLGVERCSINRFLQTAITFGHSRSMG